MPLRDLPTLPDHIRNSAVKPFRPLTVAQERVANLLARGWSYKRIGARLNMKTATVKHHVQDIAGLLPDDGLPAKDRVLIWALCVALAKEGKPAAA